MIFSPSMSRSTMLNGRLWCAASDQTHASITPDQPPVIGRPGQRVATAIERTFRRGARAFQQRSRRTPTVAGRLASALKEKRAIEKVPRKNAAATWQITFSDATIKSGIVEKRRPRFFLPVFLKRKRKADRGNHEKRSG